jgi:hypothetical protein
LFIAKPFVYVNYFLVKALLGYFHVFFFLPENIQLYPDTFNCFHLPGYAALIFSTKSINWRNKRSGLIIGFTILWAVYFIFLLSRVLLLSLNIKPLETPFISLILINQWILPFALWIAIVRKEIFKPSDIYECPLCGSEKSGIIDHIRAKHGENALKAPTVQAFLRGEEII